MTQVVDSAGQTLELGKILGSGGEGTVYDVPDLQLAAKIYHEPLPAAKQRKMAALVAAATPELQKVAAWPQALLYRPSGEMCGLLMPRLTAQEPLHHLYSPAQRKQKFADKSWAFLVHVARNLAQVFAVIHAHGHVIGDVNPNLVYVSGNGLLTLIDCDSFQITDGSEIFGCDVGVAHYLAPELQQYTSFRGLIRTPNQDNFGLALLIFHLLMMGRHPYAGVRADLRDMSLEQSIAESAYVFSATADQQGLKPPPHSITPQILPVSLRHLFEQAFASSSDTPNRPTPRDWLDALIALQSQIKSCAHAALHRYWQGLAVCPWCAHQERAGVYFFLSLINEDGSTAGFDLAQVWSAIAAIDLPPMPNLVPVSVKAPVIVKKKVSTQKLFTRAARHRWWRLRVKLVLLTLSGLALMVWPWQLELMVIWLLLWILPRPYSDAEQTQLQDELQQAEQQYQNIQHKCQQLAHQHPLLRLHKRLQEVRQEYESLGEQFLREQQALKNQLRERQLLHFLEGFLVEETTLPNIGVTRRAMLLSFGIETAADAVATRIQQIPGFSNKLSYELQDWRHRLEAWFVFNPQQGIDPRDIAALKQRFAFKRTQLQAELQAGPAQLKMLRADLQAQYQQIQPVMQWLYQRWQLALQANRKHRRNRFWGW